MKSPHTFFLAIMTAIVVGTTDPLLGESPSTAYASPSRIAQPLIGIASLPDENYVRAVRDSGGIPVILPKTDGSPVAIDGYLQRLDALLMPGGPDIPPSEWNEEPHPTTKVLEADRYRFEKALISAWIQRTKKPLLGICLGSQWINVAHGGSLVQDIPSAFQVNHRDVTHPVTLEADSRLAAIFGETQFEVNSHHHQAVSRLGAGLRIVAKSPDGIVEATETTTRDRFLIGVQWHPEKIFQTDARQRKLFRAFIEAASAPAASDAKSTRLKPSATTAITVMPGSLPILLTAPHGGHAAIPGVGERRGEGLANFVAKADTNTDVLTEKLAEALERKLGQRPYVVLARFHRKYLDANRPAGSAYESELAKPAYDAYHQALATARQEILERWGSGLLIDIHGQATAPNTIYRGTRDGKTTSHLIQCFGEAALIGDQSLGGLLAHQGFRMMPPPRSKDKEDLYNGGHTVATYGSSSGGTMDAIQLELGLRHRAETEIPATAEKLANAITSFAKAYLPSTEKTAATAPPLTASKKLTIGVYLDKGAGPSGNNLLRVLEKLDQVTVTKLTAAHIRTHGLADIDLLIHPGGSGGEQGRNLQDHGRERIRDFVREGGGFIGICAGAYLATAHYPWSLNLLDAKVVDSTHWKRGIGSVHIEMTPIGQEILQVGKPQYPIHYANGPLLAPGQRPELEDYEALANFKSEIATNGAPTGVMIGTTAIARGKFGQGRVICFSPHPEMTAGLEVLVQRAIDQVKRVR